MAGPIPALVVWFLAVALIDVVALGLASLLPSFSASRVLIATVLANPVDAIRTGTMLGIEGTAAFGAGSLAQLRFTNGPLGAALCLALSVLFWIVGPSLWALRRLKRADL